MTDGTREVVVARKAREAEDISSFELEDIEGRLLPPFSAGSHVDVHVGGFVRQYSLFNDPSENHRYMIAVLREHASRGGSRAMHALAEGARIRVSDPKNHFPLMNEAKHHLLFAGAIGITPILCMAERLASAGASFALHYCTRTRNARPSRNASHVRAWPTGCSTTTARPCRRPGSTCRPSSPLRPRAAIFMSAGRRGS